jgi:ribosomal protein L14
MTQIMAVTGHKSASSVAVYQRVSSKEIQVMGDIITSSVRGEQPSQLSSIMPPHSKINHHNYIQNVNDVRNRR